MKSILFEVIDFIKTVESKPILVADPQSAVDFDE